MRAGGQSWATVAVAPNFTSSLQCAAVGAAPCSLNYSQALELTCVCSEHLCNAPFSRQLINDLLFSLLANKSSDVTQTFFKIYSSANFTAELYKTITVARVTTTEAPEPHLNITTVNTTVVSVKTTTAHHKLSEIAPRIELLKQDATAPSEDDEDESEGIGAYEDNSRSQRHPASAPAAPCSFLPADENKSPPLFTNLFLITPFIMYFIV